MNEQVERGEQVQRVERDEQVQQVEGDGRVALVTGANKGIGRGVAEHLASLGMTVFVGARDARRGEEAAAALREAGGDVHAVALDVTDAAAIEAAASVIGQRFGRLDVLVNNAGITGSGQVSPQDATDQVPSTVELDMVRAVFETNVFGVIAVTNAMLPLLRRSPAPRVVNVSSHAASLTLLSDPDGPFAALLPSAAYSPSKTALNALTVHYANELRKDGILVNAVAPGFVDTDSNNHTGFLSVAQGAATVVRLATLDADGPTAGFFAEEGPVAW
ncbi:Short-chain dehydrogenase [Actinomadura meyerae]|uniref:Short-chain dehydrogenase n=1 Tax=Actinomadura meyerae TaxID=240840 RepID=A0A239NV65_9ACTN|nr:SDR family NAD(P)-dependent oxidoreductase [Actinomadura meyerae]SNT58323.1 Short-chain dehydrogenase [Actinomadura meyerae]